MKKIYLTFIFGLIIVITFSGCTATTTIISQIQPQITTSQIGIGLLQPSTTSTTQAPTSNAIAIVQNMSVINDYVTGNGYVLDLSLTPTSLAIANTQYTVSLYDEGTYRDSTTLSWDPTELNINYSTDITFPISENEYETYQGKDLTGVFSVTISPATPVTSPTGYTSPYINITSPKTYDIWWVGESVTITWTTSNIPVGTMLNVELLGDNGNGNDSYLIGTTKNTGSFTWIVTNQVMGPNLEVYLSLPGGGFGGNSVFISITSTPPTTTTPITNGPTSINITSPINGAIWHVGDTVTITWTSINLPSNAYINIELQSGNKDYLIGGITNTGSFTWVVTNQIIANQIQIELNITIAYSINGVHVSISN